MSEKIKEEELEKLKAHVEKSLDGIAKCHVFSGIITGNFLKDPVCLIQLSLGLLLNKPIFLLMDDTFVPPLKLLQVCEGYETYTQGDEKSLEAAINRLTKAMEQYTTEKKE